MNDVPPSRDPPEDFDEYYRRVSRLDPSRPSESVRRTVLNHAAQLAAERTARRSAAGRTAAERRRWRPAIFGTLAAAALAGLLVTPHFLAPRAPVTRPAASPALAASPETPAPAPQPSPPAEPSPAREASPPRPISARTSTGASAEQRAPGDSANDGAAPPPRSAAARSLVQTARPLDPGAALRRAAETGDVGALQALLKGQIDLDSRDASGRTALMLAIVHGQARAVDALLARGADPNAADSRGTTPLQAAMAARRPDIAAALQRAEAR